MTPTLAAPSPELVLTDAPQAFLKWPRQAYDDLVAWNASLLKVAHRRTPLHAWYQFRNPLAPERPDTAAFRQGRLTHAALLEPDVFDGEYAVLPENAPNRPTEKQLTEGKDSKPGTKAHTAWLGAHLRERWWKEYEESTTGFEVVSAADYALAQRLRLAVLSHPGLQPSFAPDVISRDLNELTLTWMDPASGHRCKARIDALRFSDAIRLMEVKTAEDAGPEPFGRSVANYDYLISAAFYLDGVRHCLPAIAEALGIDRRVLEGRPIEYEFIVIEKEEPHPVARYLADDDQIHLGRELYQAALAKVVAAEEIGYWAGYDRAAVPLQLPPWYLPRPATS